MASQTQIARLAGVSQSVVSRVLTGNAKELGISDETIERVRSIAKAVNYQPNQAAHMLLGRKTRLLGVIVRTFDDQFLATVLREMNSCALRMGYTLLVVGLESGEFNAQEIRLLQSYRPESFIILGTTDFKAWAASFLGAGFPIVQIGQPSEDRRVVSCGMDEAEAARLLVGHLVDFGHRRIAIIGDNTPASRGRTSFIKDALLGQAQPVGLPFCHLSERIASDAGEDAAAHLLDRTDRAAWPTAVIATGDLIALSFLRHVADRGISVPGDLSVASYNDISTAALTRPSLTTIRQPIPQMAATAMEIAIGQRPLEQVALPPLLQARESTGPIRGE